ncbi:ATP-binding protein [Erythrobacter sp. SDW2]|uniref:AAA family ATPase n=1 Tax=Erythrobacter sp. SDW2 TaxID=2907154 RepID=UPI001F35A746|nr:AAA family ATPase [Erythrobacter sp. SDW2]UIP07578.1 ATP-binding protein [Erythrobacter sp. SDW2]
MKLSLSNYRCFARTPDIEVRPLTLIVGENSSGKTSLMAALRFSLELSRSPASSFFNVYPFDLGPYDDIVHQSGEISTTKRFSLCIEKYVRLADARYFPHPHENDKRDYLVKTTFFFKSNYGDTVLSSVRLECEEDQMDVRFDDVMRVTIVSGEFRSEMSQPNMFGQGSANSAVSLQNSFYLLMGLRFRADEEKKSSIEKQKIQFFASLYDAFLSDNHHVVATPPVRSVPRKVYTASDDSSIERGESAPHELSKIKRSDKKRWVKLNRELNRMGKQSGLFSKLDVKKLTQQDSGPFQLKVTVRGRSTPIADVGYGVSQSLPIFADIINHKGSKSALLLQQPEVHLHPRAQAELGTIFAEYVAASSRGVVIAETHSDHLIDRLRIEVREGRLNSNLVNMVFLEPGVEEVAVHQLNLDGQGNIIGAPAAYRSFFIREQERVLGF